MYKRFLIITLTAIGLSFLASSCVKEKGFEDRVKDIVSVKLDSLNKQVTVLEKTQTALNDSLKNIKGNVKELSEQGKKLTDDISAVKDSLETQKDWTEVELKKISDKVADLKTEQEKFMEDVYTRLGHLWNRIQKIDVVPQYSDGSVYIGKKDTVVNFIVRPDSVAEKLAKEHPKGDSTFKFLAVKTLTKSNVNADTLKISEVSYNDGIVSVRVNGSGLDSLYFEGERSYSGCLVIGDGNSDNTSGFFPLYVKVYADLSKTGTSNCYIVSEAGDYKFNAKVKGNCADSVIAPTAVSVLWESFGTKESINVGDLVKDVTLEDGYVNFTASARKGNAVIAVTEEKEGVPTILWSWHIWLTDQPEEQDYNNDAGTMLDRNLGATSAEKGQVSALGLLYQWGRKDPFLSANGISSTTQAASTGEWPLAEPASSHLSGNNTLAYSISHPTTYIKNSSNPSDWYCTDQTYRNDTLWNVSSGKTIYDPCPVGYRVPNGGASGVWCTAFDTTGSWETASNWDGEHMGMDFGTTDKKLVGTGGDHCWYPAAGFRSFANGSLANVGIGGCYWSCSSPLSLNAFNLSFSGDGYVGPSGNSNRAFGRSLRCLSESE